MSNVRAVTFWCHFCWKALAAASKLYAWANIANCRSITVYTYCTYIIYTHTIENIQYTHNTHNVQHNVLTMYSQCTRDIHKLVVFYGLCSTLVRSGARWLFTIYTHTQKTTQYINNIRTMCNTIYTHNVQRTVRVSSEHSGFLPMAMSKAPSGHLNGIHGRQHWQYIYIYIYIYIYRVERWNRNPQDTAHKKKKK